MPVACEMTCKTHAMHAATLPASWRDPWCPIDLFTGGFEAEHAADLISYLQFRRFRRRKRAAHMISDRPLKNSLRNDFGSTVEIRWQ
jgi:hypothetical protein